MSEGAGALLRERLGDLVRRRRSGPVTPPGRVAEAPDRALAAGVEAFLPGGEWRHDRHGAVYVHERLRSDVERRGAGPAATAIPEAVISLLLSTPETGSRARTAKPR